jgi:hypothetical protein
MTPALDIDESDLRRMLYAKCGKRSTAEGNGSWTETCRTLFGSVDHEKLLALLAQRVANIRVLRLIQAMLKAKSYC